MIKNLKILWAFILLIAFNNNFDGQCLPGAIPTNYSPATSSTFSDYTPTAAAVGTEVQSVNGSTALGTPDANTYSGADQGGSAKSDLRFQIDGQGSIQVGFGGNYHFYNSKNPALPITQYNDNTFNSLVLIYNYDAYAAYTSNVNGTDATKFDFINRSISVVTGSGTAADPWKLKIEYYANLNNSATEYEPDEDVLITEVITYVDGDKFIRRDRQIVTPPTVTASKPLKVFDLRDAAFRSKTDAGYGVYSTSGIGGAVDGAGAVSNVSAINFIGITNESLATANPATAVLLGFTEITPWTNLFVDYYRSYNNVSGGSPFDIRNADAPNYVTNYNADVGYGVQYADINSATTTYLSIYEVVTTPCIPAPSFTTQPQNITVCKDGTAKLTSDAAPYVSGKTLSYQWYNAATNTAISGATNKDYTVPTTATGTFTFYVKVTEQDGATTQSNTATVTVINGPAIPVIQEVTAAACDVNGSVKISNYNSANTYTFSPATAGISIAADGTISGLTYGTTYTVTASNGTCNSATSSSFIVYAAQICPYFESVDGGWIGSLCTSARRNDFITVAREIPANTLPKTIKFVYKIPTQVVDINTVTPKIVFNDVDASDNLIVKDGLEFFTSVLDKVNGTLTFTLSSTHPTIETRDSFEFYYYAKPIIATTSGYNSILEYLENDAIVWEKTVFDISVSADCVTAQNDINQAPAGVAVSGNVLTNDETGSGTLTVTAISYTKPDGTAGTYSFPTGTTSTTIAVQGGSLTMDANGTYTFTPAAGYTGTVNIGYTASNGSTSGNANLSISVVPPIVSGTNSAPVANNDTATTEAGTAVTSNLLSNDSDPDGNTISITKVNGTSVSGTSATITVTGVNLDGTVNNNAGTLVLNPTTGAYTFTPASGFAGTVDPITYEISDGNGGTDTAALNISIVGNTGNQVFANDDADLAPKGTTMTGNVLTNDSDPESDEMSVSTATANGTTITIGTATPIPNVGTLTLNSDGSYSFVPSSNFVGTVPVKYTVCSGSPQVCDEATLYLTSIELPVIANDDTRTVAPGTSDTTSVLGNDTYNGNPATLTDVTLSQVSTTNTGVTINTSTGLVSVAAGTPEGTYTVVYKICTVNSPTYCDTASITVTVANACFEQPATKGSPLSTKHGITSMKRAGANNGNWPMLRNSAHTALESKTKGFVITRMTTEQINQIQNPVEGMLVFDKVANCLKLYVDNAWSCITTQACPN